MSRTRFSRAWRTFGQPLRARPERCPDGGPQAFQRPGRPRPHRACERPGPSCPGGFSANPGAFPGCPRKSARRFCSASVESPCEHRTDYNLNCSCGKPLDLSRPSPIMTVYLDDTARGSGLWLRSATLTRCGALFLFMPTLCLPAQALSTRVFSFSWNLFLWGLVLGGGFALVLRFVDLARRRQPPLLGAHWWPNISLWQELSDVVEDVLEVALSFAEITFRRCLHINCVFCLSPHCRFARFDNLTAPLIDNPTPPHIELPNIMPYRRTQIQQLNIKTAGHSFSRIYHSTMRPSARLRKKNINRLADLLGRLTFHHAGP